MCYDNPYCTASHLGLDGFRFRYQNRGGHECERRLFSENLCDSLVKYFDDRIQLIVHESPPEWNRSEGSDRSFSKKERESR